MTSDLDFKLVIFFNVKYLENSTKSLTAAEYHL